MQHSTVSELQTEKAAVAKAQTMHTQVVSAKQQLKQQWAEAVGAMEQGMSELQTEKAACQNETQSA